MNEEKRMVDAFEVMHAIQIGDKEVLFCVDRDNTETPYMVCYCTWDNPLSIENLFDGVCDDDYIEMMTEFVNRVQGKILQVTADRANITVPNACFTPEQCIPLDSHMSLENKVAVIRPSSLRPEYHTGDRQLVLVTGGFGASPNSRGRAVFTVNLYSGKQSRWNREDILGILKPEHMPQWAKERLTQIQTAQRKKLHEHER